MSKKEGDFQTRLIGKIKTMFPESMVLKNDPTYIQGIPDLLIIHNNKWAALECKKSADAPARPNQPYYVNKMNDMSYASFVYPENESEVLNELQSALQP